MSDTNGKARYTCTCGAVLEAKAVFNGYCEIILLADHENKREDTKCSRCGAPYDYHLCG